MSDVFANGFFRGAELGIMIWFVFHGLAWVFNTARDYFGAH